MTDSSETKSAKPKPSRARRAFGYGTIIFGVGCIFVLDQFNLIMNASQSLEEPAFVVFEHPILLRHGTVIAAEMPEVLQDRFGEFQFVKRIGGLPGDEITIDPDGSPCVNDQCYPLWVKDGQAPRSRPAKAASYSTQHPARAKPPNKAAGGWVASSTTPAQSDAISSRLRERGTARRRGGLTIFSRKRSDYENKEGDMAGPLLHYQHASQFDKEGRPIPLDRPALYVSQNGSLSHSPVLISK